MNNGVFNYCCACLIGRTVKQIAFFNYIMEVKFIQMYVHAKRTINMPKKLMNTIFIKKFIIY